MKNYIKSNVSQYSMENGFDLEVREGEVFIVGDPCYKEEILQFKKQDAPKDEPFSAGQLVYCLNRMKPGRYDARIYRTDEKIKRATGWLIRHIGTQTYHKKYPIEIAVDSGQVGFFLAQSAYEKNVIPEEMRGLIAEKWCLLDPWYAYMCETGLNWNPLNAVGLCTNSGYGDGCYEGAIYVNSDNEIVAIEIIFIEFCEACSEESHYCQCHENSCDSCGNREDCCTCDQASEDENDED